MDPMLKHDRYQIGSYQFSDLSKDINTIERNPELVFTYKEQSLA